MIQATPPFIEDKAALPTGAAAPPPTVLVVEDEPLVRLVAVEILRDDGFTVYEAADATEALDVLDHHCEVAVVFTDVDMPGMNGVDLADEIHRRRPDVRCLLTSGRHAPPADGGFLPKPYTPGRLTAAIRRAA